MISKNVIIVFTLTLLYSILRYIIFGNVPAEDIPTLIINKAIAFAMILILLLAFVSSLYKKSDAYYGYVNMFKKLAIIHVLISLSLLSPNYFPKLFSDEKLTLFGNLTVLAGVLSFIYLLNKRYRIINPVLYVLISLHLFFNGFKGWFDIEKWAGMMPPITLICFLILIVLIVLSFLNKNFYYTDKSEK